MNKSILTSFTILCLLLATLLVGTLTVDIARAKNTIYIRAEGNVDPLTAPIQSADNITYTLTDNINEMIVVERSNITIDGGGYTIDGGGTGSRGFSLFTVHNVTIKNSNIVGFYYGIYFNSVTNSSVLTNNIMTSSYDGVRLLQSSGNIISGNVITSNGNDGIKLWNSSDFNIISGNDIMNNNDDGIQVNECLNNIISGNYIEQNNDMGIYIQNASSNIIGNEIRDNRYGIDLESSSDNIIKGNTVVGNNWYGTRIIYSSNNAISGNEITQNYDGVYIYDCSANTLHNNNVTDNYEYGIWLEFCSGHTITKNNVSSNVDTGIYLRFSDENTISRTITTNNQNGILLSGSSNNSIIENIIKDNGEGISLIFGSTNNELYHNNVIENTEQSTSELVNLWNNDLEGNYWSDYTGVDSNNNGIGDSAHAIETGNVDNFPLMGMFSSFNTSLGHRVNIISNSTIEDFEYYEFPANKTIRMHVTNITSTQVVGFCRVQIPHALMTAPYNVTVEDADPSIVNYALHDDGTNRWIYFSYPHSTLEVLIYSLDIEPPTVTILSPLNDTYLVSDIPLLFNIDEPTSWIGYSLDGQANVTIVGNTTLTDLSDANHTVIIYANDPAGNTGYSETIHFSVNVPPPDVVVIYPENRTYATSSVPLTFTINKPTSWIGYSLDGQANVTITENTTLASLLDGSHRIIIYANDTGGRMGHSETIHFSINTALPNIIVIYPENRTYATSSVPLTFTINKPTSWIGYSLDGQANVTITENTTLASLLDGSHRIIIYANDTGGNIGRSDSVYFTTDITPPNIIAVSQSPMEDNVFPDDEVMVNSTVLDPVSGVKRISLNYTNGNGTWIEVEMVNIEGDVWSGLIPPFPYGTNITYVIAASDNVDNTISTVDLGYEYQYPVIPEFAPMIVLYLFTATFVLVLLTRKKHLRKKT